jgi:hypothetical protein
MKRTVDHRAANWRTGQLAYWQESEMVFNNEMHESMSDGMSTNVRFKPADQSASRPVGSCRGVAA